MKDEKQLPALPLKEALTKEDGEKILKRIEKFYNRLSKDYDPLLYEQATATIQTFVSPEGSQIYVRGNVFTTKDGMVAAMKQIVNETSQGSGVVRDKILLLLISELAQDVRTSWENEDKIKISIT